MTFGAFKDLAKRIAADRFLRDKAFNVAKNPKYDGYQRGLASMVYKFFDKKTAGSGIRFRFRFLLCVIDISSKYTWVAPLKDKMV